MTVNTAQPSDVAGSDVTYDVVREQERARGFFRIAIPIAATAAIANIAIGLKNGQLSYVLAGCMPFLAAVTMFVAKRRTGAGQVPSAMLLVARTCIVAVTINGLLFPDQFPAFEMVIVMSIVLVLPHVQGPELKRFLQFAMPFGILMPLACLWLPLPHVGNPNEHRAMISLVLVSVFCIAMLLMVQFAERLRDVVARLLNSNQALDRADVLLREEANKLRATLDSRRDAVLTLDEQARVTYCNPAARELFKIDVDATNQSKITDFIHFEFPNEVDSLDSIALAAKAQGVAVTFPGFGASVTKKPKPRG
jgi:PAS domain-containing protein